MTDQPNLALRDFLQGEQPVGSEDLWLRIGIARKWNEWKELPLTLAGLAVALADLEARGYVFAGEDEKWRLKYPQPVEKVTAGAQTELFAV